MEVKINIDESKFQELLEKELGAFTQEELHSIMKDAIREYLNKEEVLKKLINQQETDRWGCVVKGTSTMEKFVNNVDLSDVFAEPKEKIKQIISDDETLKKAAVEILANLFKTRFMNTFTQDYNFMEELSNRVAYTLSQRSQH
jgi:energy-converting hydrogenase A subunit M